MNWIISKMHHSIWKIQLHKEYGHILKFIYFEKATKFCEISTLLLTGTTKICRTKVSWIFRKFLWPSQNKWTLVDSHTFHFRSVHTLIIGTLSNSCWHKLYQSISRILRILQFFLNKFLAGFCYSAQRCAILQGGLRFSAAFCT